MNLYNGMPRKKEQREATQAPLAEATCMQLLLNSLGLPGSRACQFLFLSDVLSLFTPQGRSPCKMSAHHADQSLKYLRGV